jgi:hypothetical protein
VKRVSVGVGRIRKYGTGTSNLIGTISKKVNNLSQIHFYKLQAHREKVC